MGSLTIGQLAQAAGVHIETVRYYERRGILRDPPRSPAGYRQCQAGDLWPLQFVARAKQLGFTLTEVASLLEGHDSSDTADAVLLMAHAKVEALDDKRRELDETRERLARLINICADTTSADCRSLRVTQ
jgi:MerR family mercuric resistance operon transcriptional regulator